MFQLSGSDYPPSCAAKPPASGRLFRQLLLDWTQPSDRSAATRAAALRRVSQSLCALHGFHVELEGALPHRPAVLVANHVSYIDPIVIGSLVSLAPIAKAELRRWPIVGTFAGNYGVNFVRRGDTVSEALTLRRALRTLVSGVSVLNFPEGTTSVNRVLPFRRGIFGIARHAGVSVVPIALVPRDPALAWVGSASFLPHYTRTVFSGPHHFRMTVGAPMSPSDYESPAQMAEAARAWIREQVES